MSWRLAKSLEELRETVQKLRPDTVREKRMYGTIGDAAHATRDSDHNPWVKDKVSGQGVVRALDIPLPVGDGGRKLAERLRRLAKGSRVWRRPPHPAFGNRGYIISDGRVASARSDWKWRKYTGSNPHREHIHVSVGTGPSRYDSRRPWKVRRRDVRA